MQQHTSAIAVFCEDLREDKSGTDIILGVLPDNVAMAQPLPAAMPKLCIYIRIHAPTENPPRGGIRLRLQGPDGSSIVLGEFEESLIASTREDVRKKGGPLIGLISRVVMSPYAISAVGRVTVIANINGDDIVCGSINFSAEPPK